jgi:hypothetical protein
MLKTAIGIYRVSSPAPISRLRPHTPILRLPGPKSATPHAVIFVVLPVGGFLRSLNYTSLSALCYADMPERSLSSASALASMSQELSQSFGAALAAVLLQAALLAHGGARLSSADVSIAFLIAGLLSIGDLPLFLQLPRNAGATINGARPALAAAE